MSDSAAANMNSIRKEARLPAKQEKPVKAIGTPINVTTNMRRLTIDANIPIYKYAVSVLYVYQLPDGSLGARQVSKSTLEGVEHQNDKKRCKKVYLRTVQAHPAMLEGGFFYDLQASLYSLVKLPEIEMSFGDNEISSRKNFVRADIKISPVATTFQASTNGIAVTVNPCPTDADKSLLEAMTMMVNGPAYESTRVINIGHGLHYLRENTGITRGVGGASRSAKAGVSNSIRTLEGPEAGKPCLYMTTEFKASLFHSAGPLLDLLHNIEGFHVELKANQPRAMAIFHMIEKLEVFVNYVEGHEDEHVAYKIRRFAASARDQKFEYGDGLISVEDYFKTRHGIVLEHPLLFTIEARHRGRKLHFPVELLNVFPDQRVKTAQMVEKEQADLIKLSAATPNDRKRNTEQVARTVGILGNGNNDFVKIGDLENVKGFVLPNPTIMFKNDRVVDWSQTGAVPTDFRLSGQYVFPMTVSNWEVVFDDSLKYPEVVSLICKTMRVVGMSVSEPAVSYIVKGDLRPIFENAKAANRQLIFFITAGSADYHAEMKCLEQEFDLLTQDLHIETAEKIVQKRQQITLQNLVHKTNIKLGGLNYFTTTVNSVFSNTSRILVGLESSLQGGGGDLPVSIGFSANMSANHMMFSGGYVYTRRVGGELYASVIKNVLEKIFVTAKSNGRDVQELVVFFSGVEEGSHDIANTLYVEEIKAACIAFENSINLKFRPHITVICATKQHNARFYKTDEVSGTVSNLPPGTVIDTEVVSPVVNDWYQITSVARQGTSMSTKYTLVYTTLMGKGGPTIPMEVLKKWINELAWNLQIVFHPVSLPVPLYLAGSFSKRGAMILAHRRPVMKAGEVDLEATNNLLGYGSKKLFGTRFNA